MAVQRITSQQDMRKDNVIITEELGKWKVCAKMVPRLLKEGALHAGVSGHHWASSKKPDLLCVKFVKLFMQVLSYEANRVAKEEYHLRRRRTIYRASDCAHTGTSLHGLWMTAGKISTSFCLALLHGHYGSKCYYYSTSPSPTSYVGSGLWGGMNSFKPGGLCGSNLDNAQGGFCLRRCRRLSSIWCQAWRCYSSVHGLQNWCIGSMGNGIWCRGLRHSTRNRKRDCWCFKFPEESAILQVNSTWSVNSDTVLVIFAVTLLVNT